MLKLNIQSQTQPVGCFMIGASTGLTYSNIVGNRFSFDIGSNAFILGYKFGLNASYSLNDKFSIETGVDFFKNGNKWYILNSATTTDSNGVHTIFDENNGTEVQYNQNYINNAWLTGYKIGNKFQLIIQVGGYWAIYIQSNVKIKYFMYIDSSFFKQIIPPEPSIHIGYNEFITETTSKNANKPIDYGLIAGYEFDINISKRLVLHHNFRYYRGLANIKTDNSSKAYNKSFLFGIGIKMKLNP